MLSKDYKKMHVNAAGQCNICGCISEIHLAGCRFVKIYKGIEQLEKLAETAKLMVNTAECIYDFTYEEMDAEIEKIPDSEMRIKMRNYWFPMLEIRKQAAIFKAAIEEYKTNGVRKPEPPKNVLINEMSDKQRPVERK